MISFEKARLRWLRAVDAVAVEAGVSTWFFSLISGTAARPLWLTLMCLSLGAKLFLFSDLIISNVLHFNVI
jgi:hypothetical protein